MIDIKASRIMGNEKEVLSQLTSALAGKLGVDKDGSLWLCGVKIGMTQKVDKDDGTKEIMLVK